MESKRFNEILEQIKAGSRFPSGRMPMHLQFFADDGDGAGADGSNGGGSGEGETGGADGSGSDGDDAGERSGGDANLSFDDFLKQGSNQAEFDRRIGKAIQTAVSKAQEKWEALTDDKLSEAEKLAKMTAAEKAEYQRKKREKELNDREAEITRRELMATAKNTLAEKNLPVGLADVLNYTDADSCSQSIEAVEKAFQSAVQKAVDDRMKGGKPPKKGEAPDSEAEMRKQVEAAMLGGI